MTPEQLRASILQHAIEGKLVEQRAEEGTAEELYQQIQDEKARLIKEGKIKKEKSLAEIPEDEIPFDIPDSWKWVRLGDCTSYAQTKEKISPTEIKADMWSLDLEDIQKETGRVLVKMNAQERKISGEKVVFHKNQVLYSKLRPYLKKILVAPDDGICTPELVPFNTYMIDEEYMIYVLKSPHVDNVINAATYGVKMPRVGTDTMINLMIPLPPLEEQHRIVAKIEELLPIIDRYAKAYEKLEKFNAKFPEDMKKSILQYAIQGKLVEQRAEEGTAEELYQQIQENQPALKDSKSDLVFDAMDFDIPKTWKWVEVNQIFDFVDYRGKTPNKISDGVFLVTASNIRQGYMDYTRKEHISREEFETRKSRGITEKGDLLFTTEAPMGNASMCDLEECSCGQRVITFKEYAEGTVRSKLFMYFILSPAFQKQLVDNCTGTTAKGIKADKLKHLLIPLPPLEEQHRIAAKIEELLPLCDKLVK